MNAVVPLSAPAGVGPGFSATLARLLTDAFEALDGDIDRVRASLTGAVALLEGASTPKAATGQGGLAPWQARTIAVMVDEKLEYGLRTPELAAGARLSNSHFSRAFRAHFGLSPKQYILEKRVARAQRLMLEGGSRLSDVAAACGFADQAHLCRVFRRLVGASPRAWRRACVGP